MPDYTVSNTVASVGAGYGVNTNTTDATVTVAATRATGSNTIYYVKAKVVAVATGTFGSDVAAYERVACIKNVAGTVTLQGSVTAVATIESNAAWDCTIDVSGTNIVVKVTGAAATAITWHVQVEAVAVKTYITAYGNT